MLQHRYEQLLLGSNVVVETRLLDSQLRRDVGEGRCSVTIPTENSSGDGDDVIARHTPTLAPAECCGALRGPL
jgi:hypothetical protein